ncbi:MAG: NAD-dependent epimerase/dehydratase family protein [bacterium]
MDKNIRAPKESLRDNSWTVSLKLWGSGKPRREFLYVDDLADAVLFLMNNYNAKGIGEFINIGTGKDLIIKELAEMIKNIVGFKGEITWDSSKPDGTPQKLLNVEKLHKLEWKNKIELDEGIKRDYDWYKK